MVDKFTCKKIIGINIARNDIEIGDILKVSSGRGDQFTFILVVELYEINALSIHESKVDKNFDNPEYLMEYWAEHNQKIIEKPSFLIKGVHVLNGGMPFTYPNTVILEHFINPLTRTIIRRFKDAIY